MADLAAYHALITYLRSLTDNLEADYNIRVGGNGTMLTPTTFQQIRTDFPTLVGNLDIILSGLTLVPTPIPNIAPIPVQTPTPTRTPREKKTKSKTGQFDIQVGDVANFPPANMGEGEYTRPKQLRVMGVRRGGQEVDVVNDTDVPLIETYTYRPSLKEWVIKGNRTHYSSGTNITFERPTTLANVLIPTLVTPTNPVQVGERVWLKTPNRISGDHIVEGKSGDAMEYLLRSRLIDADQIRVVWHDSGHWGLPGGDEADIYVRHPIR